MKSKLIRTQGEFPPGSYYFEDRITGKVYNDQHTLFDDRVRQIIKDRAANHRLFVNEQYIDFGFVSGELSEQICARLNGNPKFCSDGTVPIITQPLQQQQMVSATPVSTIICRYCGSNNMEELLCQTCGGRKVVGYKCKACGQEWQR